MSRRGGHLNDVLGISYRDGDRVRTNPPRPRIRDLDRFPYPAYHHVAWERYERAAVETARGCPYACAFCSASPPFGRRYVARSLDRVVAELRTLARRHGVRNVLFSDDTFVINRQRVLEFCRRLRAEKLDIEWSCYARVNLMDQQLMEAMAGAGCDGVFYGIESGADAILRRLGKGFSVAQAEEVVYLSARYFPRFKVGFMWGLPFESMAEFEETLKLAGRFAAFGPQIEIEMSLWTPFPSSRLYAQWGHLKEFSRSFVPMLGRAVPEAPGESKTWRELVALIRGYPEVFAALHHVPEPNLAQKRDALELRTYLSGVVARLAATDERLAAGLRKSSAAGLGALHIEPNPVTLWAAAEARWRLDGRSGGG